MFEFTVRILYKPEDYKSTIEGVSKLTVNGKVNLPDFHRRKFIDHMEENGLELYRTHIAGPMLIDQYRGEGVNVDVYMVSPTSFHRFNEGVVWAISLDGQEGRKYEVKKKIIQFLGSLDRKIELY